jgi:hypothetical protein
LMRETGKLCETNGGIDVNSLLIVHCIEPIRSLPDTGSAIPVRQVGLIFRLAPSAAPMTL